MRNTRICGGTKLTVKKPQRLGDAPADPSVLTLAIDDRWSPTSEWLRAATLLLRAEHGLARLIRLFVQAAGDEASENQISALLPGVHQARYRGAIAEARTAL